MLTKMKETAESDPDTEAANYKYYCRTAEAVERP